MTADDALRFIAHEAKRCHDRDAHEALCLLLPAIVRALNLPPMDYAQALAFHLELREAIRSTTSEPTRAAA
jgi:hypothetical protein